MSKIKSQKGLRGTTVGAPPKPVNWPTAPFTIKTLVGRNQRQCELSLRNKVNKALASGELVELEGIRQKGNGVGRPKSRFVLKTHFNAATMTVKPVETTVAVVAQVAPASAPAPAPFVAPPAPVFASAPASPAPQTESNGAQTSVENVSSSEPTIG